MADTKNTQFIKAAQCLWQEIQGKSQADQMVIFAQFSYDLMCHVLAHTPSFEFGMYGDDYVIELIPDMAEWPK